MNSNMNFPAPVAVLGFLAGAGGLILSVAALLLMAVIGKAAYARWIASAIGGCALVYFGLLFGFALASREATLNPGQEKYFCEIDCHLAYSVQSIREESANHSRQLTVTLQTRFDETTISARRPKDAPLMPNPRTVELIDDRGHSYIPVALSGTPLNRQLIPGESYQTELTFQLPADARAPRLLITTPGWEQHLLIGDENSFGHKKTFLALTPSRAARRRETVMTEFSSAFLHD
jgi:hypothetical protein